MDLNEIAVFVQVVQSQSFRQAAIKLGMPNSTVSHKVAELERRLGVTLIQRTTRKLHITAAGELYYQNCLKSLEGIKAVEEELAAGLSEPQGLLRITAPVELGGSMLPGLVSNYMARYPKVQVEVLLVDRTVDLLSENVDLAIRAGKLKDSSLMAKRIGTVCFGLYASAKYLKQSGTPSHPRELIQHHCLQFTPFGTDTWRIVGPKGTLNVPLPQKLIANDVSMIKKMCLMGDGIAFMPHFYCQQEVKEKKLVHILPEWHSDMNPVHFVYPAHKFVSPKLKTFMEMSLGPLRASLGNE